MEAYDIAVIGGGPGGYVAAIRAAQLKKKVVLIEKEHLGGVCLNWGCIPTKALLKSAELFHALSHAQDYGVKASNASVDIDALVKRSRAISSKLTSGIKGLLKKNKVEVIDGFAKLQSKNIVEVESNGKKLPIKAHNIIIATGARPRILNGFEPDGVNIITSKEAMIPKTIPKSIAIIGSGAIGIEFASFYNMVGSKVTVIEAQPRILPVEDQEISAIAQKSFERRGITILTNAKVLGQTKSKEGVTVKVELEGKNQQVKADCVLVAIGVVPNTEGIGLESTAIKLDRGAIVTDKFMQTNEKGVYAIGDVTAPPWLAHKASHEGIVAVETIAGLKPHTIDKSNIPGCTYSFPQVASVGLTEAAAKEKCGEIKIGRFPFFGNGKALVMGSEEGLIKTIFDAKTGELLGAHLIGADVTELIHAYVVGKNMEATELDFIHTIFPHPTLSEMLHEAVLDAYGRAIHI